MELVEKFKEEVKPFANTPLIELLKQIDVYDIDEATPVSVKSNRTICVGNKISLDKIFSLFQSIGLQHVVQLDRKGYFREIITTAMIIKKPKQFMTNPIPFFINNFSGDPGYDSQIRKKIYKLRGTMEKPALLEEISRFIKTDSRTSNYLSQSLLLVDELISNAFFNAPADATGYKKNTSMPRSREVKIDKEARLFVVHDNEQLLIGCEDLYGSFVRSKLLELLVDVFQGERAHVRSGRGGAGLGCKMMIENSASFYICVELGVKTLVFCSLPLGMSVSKIESLSKHIHMSFV